MTTFGNTQGSLELGFNTRIVVYTVIRAKQKCVQRMGCFSRAFGSYFRVRSSPTKPFIFYFSLTIGIPMRLRDLL